MATDTPLTVDRAEQIRALLGRHGGTLLSLAANAIQSHLETGAAPQADLAQLPPELAQPGAAFVTLTRYSELRGCIGSVKAWRPLAADVASNAVAAAFEEPRFPPLAAEELRGLAISISVLTAPEPVAAASEAELLAKLRPGRDGVILREGAQQGLFLPQMWDRVSSPTEFLAWLKEKAGLPHHHWSASLRAFRFETVSVEASDLF